MIRQNEKSFECRDHLIKQHGTVDRLMPLFRVGEGDNCFVLAGLMVIFCVFLTLLILVRSSLPTAMVSP